MAIAELRTEPEELRDPGELLFREPAAGVEQLGALLDSPVGLLAWNAQLLGEELDRDFVLTNVMLYWLTGTAGSAARLYYENAHATPPTEPTTVPIGLAAFSGDFRGIRRFAKRDHTNIVRWSTFEGGGGHYAAHKVPDVLVGDVREFFRALR